MASGFQQAVTSWFQTSVDRMQSGLFEAVEDATEAGENITRHHIETRGTAKSGKRGRIETEAMLNSVSHDTIHPSPDEILGRFGYKNGPAWTPYQEKGFVSWTGAEVEGTYALSDAAVEVLQDLMKDITKVVKNG